MKRSWKAIALIGGLAALLVVIGTLQFNWLTQINRSEGEKAKKRVKEQTERFAVDFNREIQNSYFNFQTDAKLWRSKDWKAFSERYDYWREKTTYPDLITDLYIFESGTDADPSRYDRSSRTFIPTALTEELAVLRSKFSDDKTFKPFYEESLSLVVPIHDGLPSRERIVIRTSEPNTSTPMPMPSKYGYLVIRLDPATIKEKLLPDLKAKYFGDDEFKTFVSDRAGNAVFQTSIEGVSDASAGLFDLAPNNFVFFENRELLRSIDGESRPGIVVNSRIESHTFSRTNSEPAANDSLTFQVKRDQSPRMSIVTTTTTTGNQPNPWTLQIQHSSGSLETYLANELRRNLAIGFGLLFLLAAAIAAIIASAQRVRRYAQRQVDFVSSVSHEFRTPVAVIYTAGENLADGITKEREQIVRYGELIKSEGRKLSEMVEQILDFAGANSGRQRFSIVETSIKEVIEHAMESCWQMINERGFGVETDIADDLPPVRADRNALIQALQNLIANSIKYSGESRWLRISAANDGGHVRVSIEDHGLGISKGDVRNVFEPFFRTKDVVEAQIHGNGLGLSIVKQIVEAHGGRVRAESIKGKGSKFTIEIPSAQSI